MPNQKFGTEMPIWVKPITPQSPGRPCCQAANTPSGIATSSAQASASAPSGKVTCRRSPISLATEVP